MQIRFGNTELCINILVFGLFSRIAFSEDLKTLQKRNANVLRNSRYYLAEKHL